jgi:hypothetical protein
VGQVTRTVASSLCGSSVPCPVASACVGGGFAIDSPQAGDHVGPIRHRRRGRCPPRLHLLRRCRMVRLLSVASERPKHPDCGSNPVQSRIPRQYFGFNVRVYTHVPRASLWGYRGDEPRNRSVRSSTCSSCVGQRGTLPTWSATPQSWLAGGQRMFCVSSDRSTT